MQQDTQSSTSGGQPVTLPDEMSGLTLSEALQEFGIEGDNGMKMLVTPTFEATYISEDETCVVWEKDFSYRGEKNITRAIFVEYLAYLMPELYNVSCDWVGNATIAWATLGADTLTLGAGVSQLSEHALHLINGEVTIDELWGRLYTDENTEKISRLLAGPHIAADVIVRTIMSENPLPLAYGEL